MASKKIHVSISNSNLTWFKSEFGEDTSISWYLDGLLSKAKEVHERERTSVKDGQTKAVEMMKEEIEG